MKTFASHLSFSSASGRILRVRAKVLAGLLAVCSLAVSARAQTDAYATEFGQATNRFGTVNLVNGCFTQIASLGGTVISDIAYSPLDGVLYGIRKSGSRLVTFNKTTGANLFQWTAISTNVTGLNGSFTYVDTDAANYSRCFYRTAVPQL